jgi:hypothetical protein
MNILSKMKGWPLGHPRVGLTMTADERLGFLGAIDQRVQIAAKDWPERSL